MTSPSNTVSKEKILEILEKLHWKIDVFNEVTIKTEYGQQHLTVQDLLELVNNIDD